MAKALPTPRVRLKTLTTEEIVQRLIWLREARGLTIAQVAARSGYSRQQVWNLETGKISKPSVDLIQCLCHVYGISLSQFFAGMDPLSKLHPKAIETALLLDAVFSRNANKKPQK